MLIGFEASSLQGCKSGVGYYTENLMVNVMRAAPEHRYMLFSNKDLGATWNRMNGEVLNERYFPVRQVWMQAVLPAALREVRPDICHFTNYIAPLAGGCPSVVTIHDMTVFITPRMHQLKKLVLDRTLIPRVARRADAIITESHSARRDILRYLKVPKEKVRVILGAAAPIFRPVTDEARLQSVRDRYGLHGPFVLYVGTIEPRKNLVRLIEAFARIKKKGLPHRLVIVGQPGWGYESTYAAVERLGLKQDVLFPGYVPLEDLPPLYSLAESMAFPSIYEGFGLPVIEAMACGAPVITSRNSSLVEVAGEAAILVNAYSVEEIADAIYNLHADPNLREDRRARGLERSRQLTWEAAARATLDLYHQVCSPTASNGQAVSPSRGF